MNDAPNDAVSQVRARIVIRSTTPANVGPSPSGSWIAIGDAPSRVRISSSTRAGSAPSRSHLLMNAIRGIR